MIKQLLLVLSLTLLIVSGVSAHGNHSNTTNHAPSLLPQITAYQFENNLDDAIGNHTATFLEDGEAGTAVYAPFNGSTALSMTPAQGLRLPRTVNDSLDIDGGIEVSFDFQVPEIDTVFGTVYLFSVTEFSDLNSAGIYLVAVRGEPGEPDEPIEYGLRFIYADGRSSEDASGHEGHWRTDLGYFRLDQTMNIRLSVEFETRTWTTLVNGELTSSPFEAPYDLGLIKTAITENDWHFGWIVDQAFIMDEWEDHEYTADMLLDNLQIASPISNGDTAVLQSALTAMTAHANGNAPLDEDALQTHLTNIYLNYRGNYANAEAEIWAFVEAYEANYPPVFENRWSEVIDELAPETQALIFLQQTIFDQQFVDGNMENMEGIAYEFASIFPGTVSDSAPIVSDAAVMINATNGTMPGAPVISDGGDAKRPTGYYAPPGALIAVDIPNDLTDAGLKVMVGAHEADFSGLNATNRFVRISKTILLDSASTAVVNPFGGAIYIKVPEGVSGDWVEITLSGAVKSPYFSTLAENATDMATWETDVANAHVQWVDLESDKNLMTLPLAHLIESGHSDPTALMAAWDEIMDGYRFVGGRPPEREQAEYFLIDSRLPDDGAFGTGYPQIIGDEFAPFGPFDNAVYYPTQVFNPDFHISEFNTTLHEWGHAMFHPTVDGETESIIHLNASYIYDVQFGIGLDDGFKYSSQEFLSMDETALEWMTTFNFRNDNEMGCDPTMAEDVCDEIRYQHRGHAKYVEMARLFGWEAVFNMNQVYYDAWRVDDELDVTRDSMLRAAAQSNNANMSPLFHFWGHPPSAELAAELENLPASPEIRGRLLHYLTLIPTTQAQFAPTHAIILEGKGETHAERLMTTFDEYDSEQYAVQMQAQICNLLDTYYPDEPVVACGGTVPLATSVSSTDANHTLIMPFSVVVGVLGLLIGSAAVISRRRL